MISAAKVKLEGCYTSLFKYAAIGLKKLSSGGIIFNGLLKVMCSERVAK